MRNVPKKKRLHSLSLNIDLGQQNAGKLMVTHFICYYNRSIIVSAARSLTCRDDLDSKWRLLLAKNELSRVLIIIYAIITIMRALIDDILAVKIIQKNILVSSTVVNSPPRPPYFTCSCPDTKYAL